MKTAPSKPTELRRKSSPPAHCLDRCKTALLDLLFPPRCGACGIAVGPGSGGRLCEQCSTEVSYLGSPICTCCGAPLSADGGREDRFCRFCLASRPAFDRARSLLHYRPPLSRLLHRFKFQGDTAAGACLSGLVAHGQFNQMSVAQGCELIIPVPLHRSRLRARGMNQSLVLARLIFRSSAEKIRPSVLIRIKNTRSQTDLSGDERRQNLRGVFAVNPKKAVAGKRILLVDDVFTTGTTVDECAKTLKKQHAAEILVWTLARA
jgi:ComF family protein